jgi:hypothetical protein
MPKDKKNKKKIGWWRWLAKAFGLPLLGIGKSAVTEFIDNPSDKPLQDFCLLSIDFTEDILEIYTDLVPENKQQMKELLDKRDEEIIIQVMALLTYLIPKILKKIGEGKKISVQEGRLHKVYKAINGSI